MTTSAQRGRRHPTTLGRAACARPEHHHCRSRARVRRLGQRGDAAGGGRDQGAAAMLRGCWGTDFGVFEVSMLLDEQSIFGEDPVVTDRYVGSERTAR